MTIIIPMAGNSSRFPDMKPKWMLTHPSGKYMTIQSLSGLNLNNVKNIVFIYLQEHEDKFHFLRGFVRELSKLGIYKYITCPLNEKTKDVVESVSIAIEKYNISGPILIKDPDAFFSCSNIVSGNFVFYSNLKNVGLIKPHSKSYITIDENNIITNIVEKSVVSQTFCVGGYLFEDAEKFMEIVRSLKTIKAERYISDIICAAILYKKLIFKGIEIFDFEDWGTLEEWNIYQKRFVTLFVDIDGVIVENASNHFPPYVGESGPLKENVEYLESLSKSRVEIVFTTSRNEEYRKETESQLKELGLEYKQLIMGLRHNRRIIVNDYSKTNPYRSCDAINIPRNQNILKELLENVI